MKSSISISKDGSRIRATGSAAGGLLIAMCSDDALMEAYKDRRGDEEFQRMVKEALIARGVAQYVRSDGSLSMKPTPEAP